MSHSSNVHVFIFFLASHRRPIFNWMHWGAGTVAQIIAGKGDRFHPGGVSEENMSTVGRS